MAKTQTFKFVMYSKMNDLGHMVEINAKTEEEAREIARRRFPDSDF